jgi:hypothetical protein
MKILIVHLGSLNENLVATSVLNKIKQKVDKPEITWVAGEKNQKYIFKYTNVSRVLCFPDLGAIKENFDLLINLCPVFFPEAIPHIGAKEAIGFNFSVISKGITDNPDRSLFQMYYKLTGATWKGEGYQIGYFPRTKTKRNRIGIAVAHANLRNYVIDELHLESGKLWHIPYKKNIFKKMDEINKCEKIVTDDLTTFHLAMVLRKYVYFLQTFPLNTKLELFGNGQIYEVPHTVFQ